MACKYVSDLHKLNSDFITSSRVKDLTENLRTQGIFPNIQVKWPTKPWDAIWNMVFDQILDTKLQVFCWKVAHNVVMTRVKLLSWRIGDGGCPLSGCQGKETLSHALLECNQVFPIVQWAKSFLRPLLGNNVQVSNDFWLYGSPSPGLPSSVIRRAWYILTLSKFFIWKRRCMFLFENRFIPNDDVIKLIRHEILERVTADFERLPKIKFERFWVKGDSFITTDSTNRIALI